MPVSVIILVVIELGNWRLEDIISRFAVVFVEFDVA